LLETILLSNSFSYGIAFSEDKSGNILVDALAPGGPAWRAMQIQEGDILFDIFPQGQTIGNSACLNLQTVYELLHNPAYHILTFKFRKKNGEETEISLLKEVIENTENSIEGYVLSGEYKTGYIQIPDFYTSDSDSVNSGSAADLARALIDLKSENIQSLIIDLRNNTGGSVREAVEMCGLFIDYGTVSMYAERDNITVFLKDTNRGMAYSGPLLILVNEYSASASEIFAAAMQDYNRALIVGTKTFGKGSGQVILPVTGNPEDIDILDIMNGIPGYVKITTDKMFRITGQTHQRNGITPDVELPKIKTLYDYAEIDYAFNIGNEISTKKAYFTPLPAFPSAELRQKSNARCAAWHWQADSLTGEWDLLNATENLRETSENDYLQTLTNIDRLWEATFALYDFKHQKFSVSGTKNNLKSNELNNFDTKHYLKHIEDLQKDRYLYESYLIMSDFLNIKSEK